MAKMTLEDLRNLRDQKKRDMQRRETTGNDMQILVGMGTCGIAAGAKKTLDAFITELDIQNLDNVAVTQTGCMGLCFVEPTVEIVVPGMPNTIYGQVDADTARKIVHEHIQRKKMVSDHVYDRPAADIIQNGGK